MVLFLQLQQQRRRRPTTSHYYYYDYYYHFCFLLVLLQLLVTRIAYCTASNDIDSDYSDSNSNTKDEEYKDEGYRKLVTWMEENGGRVDPRWDVRSSPTNSNHDGIPIRGAIATSTIEIGTELLFCPWKLILGSEKGYEYQMKSGGDEMCTVIESMANEIRLGTSSLWYPYLNHIGELPRLISDWDESAVIELQGILPSNDPKRHYRWFHARCSSSSTSTSTSQTLDDDVATKRSLVAFISRASEVGMIPIYDLFNHHNGKRNCKLQITKDGVQLVSIARTITAGEEIYNSYGIKPSSMMLRDYGFIEDWPTCWNFITTDTDGNNNNFAFITFPQGYVAINPTEEYLKLIIWSGRSSNNNNNMSLIDYQNSVTNHTITSLSIHDLDIFTIAVTKEINKFSTTIQDDEMILHTIIQKRSTTIADDSSSSDDDNSKKQLQQLEKEDIIASIEYRMAYKRALTDALRYAESSEIRNMIKVGSDDGNGGSGGGQQEL